MNWLAAVLALCFLIIVHELGHYLVAVWTGMRVERFSVFGIGPAIVKLGRWRGTEFVIGAIPFGAYVLIRGMDPRDSGEGEADRTADPEARESSGSFRDKPLWSRMAMLAGGPGANYVAAILLYFGVFVTAGVPGGLVGIDVGSVAPGSPAEAAGLQPGDELVRIGSTAIDPKQQGLDIRPALDQGRGRHFPIVVSRAGRTVELTTSLPADPQAPLGITYVGREAPREGAGLGTALVAAVRAPFEQSALQLRALWLLVTFRLQADMQGPVGIVSHMAHSVHAGAVPFLMTTALISTLLGLFNLLPFPALDGGRIAFLGYEAVTRRRANPLVEEFIHGYGMLVLLTLVLVFTVGDIRRLF